MEPIKVIGKQIRYWDRLGQPQLPAHVVLSEVRFSPIIPESLKNGTKVLCLAVVDRGSLEFHCNPHSLDSVVYAFPEEPKTTNSEMDALEKLRNRASACVTNKEDGIIIKIIIDILDRYISSRV